MDGESIRKVGVLGDIHGEDASLATALQTFADAGVDRVLAVGDIVDGRDDVDRCCALLRDAGALAVRGNHERWFLAGTMRDLPDATLSVRPETRAFLEALPATRHFETAAGPILLCHGLDDEDMASVAAHDDERTIGWWNPALCRLVEADTPLIVINGHSHKRLVWSFRRLTVLNAGTLYRAHDPCFMIVDLADREVTWIDLDDDHQVARKETRLIPLPRGARR